MDALVTAFPPNALASLDIESTSTDVEDARTVQICLAIIVAGRHGVPALDERRGGRLAPVRDPLVLDKQCIRYRRRVSPEQGARCLKTLCQVYRVGWDDNLAHSAEYDALQAARVVWRIGQWA